MAVLSIGQVWAQASVGTTLFSENFGGYSNNDVPSGSVSAATNYRVIYGTNATVTYTCTDGAGTKPGTTYVTTANDGNLAGGTSPEILVGKKGSGDNAAGGSFSISGIPNGGAKEITVAFKQNNQNLSVTATGTGYTGSISGKPGAAGERTFDVTVADGADATFTLTFQAAATSNVRVDDILVTVKTAGEGAAPATPTCAKPTFSPADGETFEESIDVEIEAESGTTIYYTTDGEDPTTSSDVYTTALNFTETTTLKAIAVKEGSNNSAVATATYTKMVTVPGYEIDFESELAAYTDWTFVNFTKTNETITVHGGSYFAKTNATNTASITTKAKVANPGILTYYISKIGTNTNANSKWKARVSEDGTNWTIVGTEYAAASDVTAGTWKTCTADLTSYSNVFVQVYYDGTTAVRTIDDISLEMASAVAKPTISGEDNFLSTTEVTISIPDGATVYYTTDGSDPKSGSTYSAPFTLDESATVRAIAKIGEDYSAEASKEFTKATVLTPSEALAIINGWSSNQTSTQDYYVAGTISQIDAVNADSWATYYISADGTTTDQLQVYKGLWVNGANFSSADQIQVGDDVTIKGKLKKYNSYKELDQSNEVVLYKLKARLAWSAESFDAALEGENTFPSLTNTNGVEVTYSSSDAAKASFADASVYDITLNAVGSTTITASFAGNETYKANSVSYTLNVASSLVTLTYNVDGGEAIASVNVSALPNPLPTTTKAGKNFGGWFTDSEKTVKAVPGAAISENTTLFAKWLDPYTVAEAKTVIDANPDGIANQYVAGIISQIDSYNNTYHSITYWISADGTTTNQLQVYSGLIGNAATALEKEQFTAKTDLELGDEVVVTGTLKLYDEKYEFDKNNSIYTFSRKASAGLEYAVTAVNKVVGDDAFVNTLTNPNELAVSYESSDDEVAEVANDGTVTIIGAGTATITASFAGNNTYKAAHVSYTLTVSATVDTRKVANSPATFTAVSGDLTPNDITYASYQGGSSTAPANYNDGIRLYQISGSNDFGGFVTITAKTGCTIDEVQITTTSKYATTVAYSVDGNENLLKQESVAASSSYTTGTSLNVSSVNILNLGTGSDGRLEIASIKVYYTGEPAAIDHYDLGGTYQTAFMQNEDFNHTGLIVYAAYDALGENKVDITSMCTFSEPDMSTTGEKTIEITYNEAVVASYTINVAADSRKVADSPATFTAVSGDLTPADIMFESYKGGAGNDPYLATGGIRLYQISGTNDFGGFITLKAKKGCTIDQVKITTSAEYATTVAYSVDGNENLLGTTSVEKSGSYTTPAGLNKESVNILNLGTGSSGRLEIASIKVWYTGDALAVDHYILGGTYETVFEQFGTFSYEGLTVTAAYDAEETITETITGFTVEADLSTAGNKKAEVMLNSVKIAEYDITVTASAKEDPALAYDPTSVILTKGDALSAPTFSNTYGVAVSYESDNEAVATVDAEGNIALAGGVGTAVITASFAGNEDYIESEATFTITVNAPAEDLNGTWVVATSVAVGDRIIIGATYQDATKTMGAQNTNNRAAVESTLAEDVLTPAEGTKTFTLVDAGDGKFAIQALNGKYLTASGTGTKNYLTETADYEADNAKWTISFEGNEANVVASSSNRNTMRYNSGDGLFSCYATGGQRAINIYKQGTPEPTYTEVRGGLTAGNYYTVCLPKKVTAVNGATFWNLEKRNSEGTEVYLEEAGLPFAAGTPFIINATADKLEVVYEGDATSTPVESGALRGTLTGLDAEAFAALTGNIYILKDNAIRPRTEGNWLSANRAYIDYAGLDAVSSVPQSAPGKRVIAMPMQKDQAQGFENLDASEKPLKVMIDGTLYILRGEKVYDATGRLVK